MQPVSSVFRPLRRLALLAGLCIAVPACAEHYDDHPAAAAFIDELVAGDGFEREALEALFAEAERQESILDAIARPAEKTKPWHEYRDIFLTDRRTDEGIAFLAEHGDTLAAAEAESGVPAAVIAAVLGVETYYGRITGSYAVIDALSTLAFDYPPRSPFFRRELRHFLLLAREQGLDPASLEGSYAGAMGYGQFMPSSYRSYAVDFDGDGLADIWNNPADAIGSVANYLARHGWRPGEPVAAQATLAQPVPEDWFDDGLDAERTVAELGAGGLVAARELPADAPALALALEGDDGPEYWIGLPNFYVITRYNRSALYAMAVYQLSERLREGQGEGAGA
jgi:membrane-bound lytic murein transglycosylase B